MNKLLIALVLLGSFIVSSDALAVSYSTNTVALNTSAYDSTSHNVFFGHNESVTWGRGWMHSWSNFWSNFFSGINWDHWTTPVNPDPGHNSNAVPEMDATSGIIAFGLLAGLIGLIRERKLKAE